VFLRKADVLKIACIAQIVNVIAPIMTNKNGMFKQSIFYPLELFSRHAAGVSLEAHVQVPSHDTKRFGEMPLLDVSASFDEEHSSGAAFLVNRSQTETLEVDISWQGTAAKTVTGTWQVTGSDPKAANSFEQPNTVVAHALSNVSIKDARVNISLPPMSFTTITVGH
jgi:alpha-L-arabinofuranosidase